MLKLFAFAVLLSVAAARPSIIGPPIVHLPAAISHQSHTQIHSHPIVTHVVSPIVHPVSLVHSPWVHSHVVAGPIVAHHGWPIVVHG